MTREESIEHLKNMKMPHDKFYEETDEANKALIDKGNEALYMGIEALKNQKTGHWIISERDYTPQEYFNWNKTYLYKCSNCGREYEAEEGMGENYCANCGAKMEGESNE